MAFSRELEELVEAVIADGVITEKERIALRKRAARDGIDPEEIEVLVESRLDDIRKRQARSTNCPVCQAEIPYGVTICPKCGWQRSKSVDIAASNFIQDFSKGLAMAEKQDREREFTENYPLPNSKADLIEFAMLLKAKTFVKREGWGDKKNPRLHIVEWDGSFKKYKECIEKLKMFYPNDPQANQIVDNYQRLMKYETDYEFNQELSKFDEFWTSIVVFIIAIVIGIVVYNVIDDWGWTSFMVSFVLIMFGYYFYDKSQVEKNTRPLENIDELL